MQSTKRKRKGKPPLTGRKETTNAQQTVIFNEGGKTELLLIQRNQYYNPLFDLNKIDNNAQHLLCIEIPQTLCLGK